MADTFWLKQKADQPLFSDLLWSRPENKRFAGKLLIIGGNRHGFAAVGTAYNSALTAGIGVARLTLPDKLARTLGKLLPEAQFAPSTISGSFSQKALDQFLDEAAWADGVLLAGDFGRNSETAILLDKFLVKFSGQLVIAGDAVDYFLNTNSPALSRPKTTLIINLGKLQKLAKHNRRPTPILHDMQLKDLIELLHEWTNQTLSNILTKHAGQLIVASNGRLSTTPSAKDSWQAELPAYTSVWLIQQPKQVFAALSCGVYEFCALNDLDNTPE